MSFRNPIGLPPFSSRVSMSRRVVLPAPDGCVFSVVIVAEVAAEGLEDGGWSAAAEVATNCELPIQRRPKVVQPRDLIQT